MEDKEIKEIENEDETGKKTDEEKTKEEISEELKKEEKNTFSDLSDDEKEFFEKINKFNKRNKVRVFRINPMIFFMSIIAIVLALYFRFGISGDIFSEKTEISYTSFIEKIKTGDINEVLETSNSLEGKKKIEGKTEIYTTNKITYRLGEDTSLMTLLNEKNVDIKTQGKTISSSVISLLLSFLPMVLMLIIYIYISRRIMGSSGSGSIGMPSIFSAKNNKKTEKPNVKFSDIAGLVEEKEELIEIVEFLKDPTKFEKAGARIPKGILLLGEPGTGKTLLAKAVAGETGASFFSISGSEFVELYVGAGALKVRELFKEAKAETPAIIFIDEIDAVGRRRSQGRASGGNDEREQTLNQLLVEMDGFETDQGIIVIAATNRADVLDAALLRGGRFDRRITVSRPDLAGRVAILKIHSRNKKLASDVNLEDIAKITPGFVGADLENLLNEAAILAARRSSDTISREDLDEAVDKLGMGLGQKNKIISPREKDMLAYHEGGHALVASLLENANKVHKVTIIPRGDAGGYMMPLPEESLAKTKKQLLAEINVLFAGRAAEEIMMDDVATGAYSDIKRATEIAKIIITSVGMNDLLGPINYEAVEDNFINTKDISNETNREIDLEIRKLLKEKYEETLELLKNNKDKLENIAKLLKEKETVTGLEIRAIVSGLTVEEVLNANQEILERYN